MSTAKGKTFKSGNSEAVRLPKGFGFGVGVELDMERTGEVVTLRPAQPKPLPWAEFWRRFEALPGAGVPWVREPVEIPDREAQYLAWKQRRDEQGS